MASRLDRLRRRPPPLAAVSAASAAEAAVFGQLAHLPAAIRALDRGVADLTRAAHDAAVADETRAQDAGRALTLLLERTADLDQRLRDVQALAARAYEAAQGWPEQLAAIRRSPAYEPPFRGDPLISVMMPTHDRADVLLSRALPSLLAQTYEHWEAVVVADRCGDDTVARVRALGDPRITVLEHGGSAASEPDAAGTWLRSGVLPGNVAIDASRGAWLARLDDDDAFDAHHLETLLRAAQEARAELAYGRVRVLIPERGIRTECGSWPPHAGDFSFIGALYHGGLRRWHRDPNCALAGEPADWNFARRVLEAGVRFHFVDRVVGTYHPSRDGPDREEVWARRMAERPLAEGA